MGIRAFSDCYEKEFASARVPIVSSLNQHEANMEKIGQEFTYNGTLWTYAKEGQFGSFPAGFPHPVKGYRDTFLKCNSIENGVAELVFDSGDITGLSIYLLQFGIGSPLWISEEELITSILSPGKTFVTVIPEVETDDETLFNNVSGVDENLLVYVSATESILLKPRTLLRITVFPPTD